MSNYEEHLFGFNIESYNQNIKNSGFLDRFISDSFLRDQTDPYFVYTKNGLIKPLENLKINDDKIPSVYLYEPLTFKTRGRYNFTFYSEFDLDEIDSISCDELDSIETFRKNNSLPYINVYTKTLTYRHLENLYPNLKIRCLDIYLRHISYELLKKDFIARDFTETFWCGNRRYTHHRLLMMLKLQDYPGRYSWRFDCSDDILEGIGWLESDFINRSRISLLNSREFSIDSSDVKVDIDRSDLFKIPDSPNYISEDMKDSYLDCFCAVVNESVFAQPFPDLGEKILNPIFFEMPFILVSAPGSLRYLHDLGFKTFDRWWDESYDLIENHQQRVEKLYDLIDYIGSLSRSKHIDIKKSMGDVLKHNRDVLRTLKNNDLML